MKFLSYLRVETARLLRNRLTWLVLAAAALCPLAGYSLYQPAGTWTTAAIVLANPLLAGALGGMFLLAVLTLFELNRVKKGGMEPLTDSILSPLKMIVVKTASLLLAALLSSLLTFLLYLPSTWLQLGTAFRLIEYCRFAAIFLLPSLVMGVLLAAAFYQLFRRVDLSFICFAALLLAGLSHWSQGTYLLYWINLSSLGFSGDFGNTAIYRMALYSRLLWLFLFAGLWICALLCVRANGKGLLGSLSRNLRKVYLPLLGLALLAGGAVLYLEQPYMDHALPLTLDTSGVTGGGMTVTMSGMGAEQTSLLIHQTELDVRLDARRGALDGEARYQMENISGASQDCLLEIAPGYHVEHITVNGEEIPFTDLANDYYIMTKNIALTLPAQRDLAIVIAYHGRPQIPAHLGALMLYYEITPEYINLGGAHVLPSFQGASAQGCSFTGQVTLPADMTLITTGEQAQVSQNNADGTTTWHIQGDGLRPVLFGGNYTQYAIDKAEFPAYFCYSKNHQQEFEQLDIETLLQNTLSYCTEKYGPLPYTEDYPLRIVMSSAHMTGGGANANLSFMGESFFTAANLNDPLKGASAAEVIAHEIIHQWWGIECFLMDVDNSDWSSEALTCYTTYRIAKALNGAEYAQQFYVDVWQDKYHNMLDNFYLRYPEYLAMLPNKHQAALHAIIFDANIYGKAPLQILKAEQLVGGEEKMDAILSGLFQNGGTEMPPFITWQDFLDACGLTEDQLTLEGDENLD